MLRQVTWRSWALLGTLFAIYLALGLTWTPGSGTEEWIFKTGTLGATFAPLLLVAIYTASGLRGAAKWWTNDVGSALVQLALSIAIIAGPLAWSSWLDDGSITGGMVAWLEIAGPVLVTLAILRICWVFIRIHRRQRAREASVLTAAAAICLTQPWPSTSPGSAAPPWPLSRSRSPGWRSCSSPPPSRHVTAPTGGCP